MAKGRRTDKDIVDAIHELASDGYRPADIHRRLNERFGLSATPVLRTVENIAREVTPHDTSEAWRLAAAEPAAAAIILPVLAELLESSEGRIQSVSRREAEWIVRLRGAVPDLPAIDAYKLARDYLARRQRNEDTADLDWYLVMAPWRPGNGMRYIEAAAEGRLPGGRIVHMERVGYFRQVENERAKQEAELRANEGLRSAIAAHYARQSAGGGDEASRPPLDVDPVGVEARPATRGRVDDDAVDQQARHVVAPRDRPDIPVVPHVEPGQAPQPDR
jgi:hypothetical protein